MTYIIAEPCVDVTDTACVDVCPVDCIYLNDESNSTAAQKAQMVSNPVIVDDKPLNTLLIHPEECIDCGACEPECPVEAIYAENDVPEESSIYIKYNYEAFGMTPP